MSLFHSLLAQSGVKDETATGKQLWLIVGDSISAGQGVTAGPTASSGTLYEFTTTEVELTTAEVSTASNGSPWKQWGITYNARTGKKPVLLCCGSSGSEFYPTTDNNNWYSSGTLRGTTETKVSNAFSNYGLNKLKGIIVILGINDIRFGTSRANMTTGINSFVSWLSTTYPNTPVYMVNVGREETNIISNDIIWMRKQIIALAEANTYFHVAASLAPYFSWGYYKADNLHPSQTGNNLLGNQIDRYLSYEGVYTTKKVRTPLCVFETEVSLTRRGLIKDFIETNIANGNWALLSGFQFYKNSTANNALVDWVGWLSADLGGSPTFTANDNYATNGTSSYFITRSSPTFNENETIDDMRVSVFVKDNLSGTGSVRTLFGCQNSGATSSLLAAQLAAGNIRYRVNDQANNDYTGETVFADAAEYTIRRTASNAIALFKNGSSVHTATSASVSLLDRGIFVGARNNGGTADQFISGQFISFSMGKAVGFSDSAWKTALDTLNAGW